VLDFARHLAGRAAFAAHGLASGSPVPIAFLIAVSVVGLAFVALMVVLITVAARRRPPDHNDRGEDGGGDGGGGRPPEGPDLTGGGPSWWPEFEREFADYVALGRPLRELSARQ
jgi:hypothetical protein